MGKENMHYKFEDILSMVGDQNKWQIVIFLYTWIEGFLIGFHHLSSSYLGASDGHWCNLDKLNTFNKTGWSLEQMKNYSLPLMETGDKYESCKMYDLSGINKLASNIDFETALKNRGNLDVIGCPGEDLSLRYQYDTSNGIDSIVYQWNLVCDDTWKLSTIQGSYMGGVFVGCMIWGWASDKFGRRLTMLVAAVIQVVSSILAAFAPNYIIFIFLRFLIAFSVSGVFECGFVLVTEICGPKYRTYFGILTQFPFGCGAALLPVIAYFIRQWQNLQLAISVPCVLLGIFYWTIPESPRWLMAEGRFDEAMAILKAGAKRNKKQLPSDDELMEMMKSISADEEDKEVVVEVELSTGQKIFKVFDEIFVLVKTPEMRKRTLNIFFSWLIVAMVYYGLSLNSKNLGGDRYVNGFLSGFVEVPAVVVIIPLLAKLGRVKCYSGTFIAGGICCCLVALVTVVTDKQSWAIALSVAIGIVGKFLISMTFAIAYLYTAELFPTKVRNLAVGLASTFARIGSISAPYIVDLLGSIHASIPVVIFGLCSFAAGITSLMLPETLNRKLPESIAEVERSGKRKNAPEQEEMNAVALPAETQAEGGE